MTSEDSESAEERPIRLLRRLFKGLDRRLAVEGAARIEVDKQLIETLDAFVGGERQPPVERLADPPPRAVGLAMAMAIFSQPHLAVMFSDTVPVGTEEFEPPPDLHPDPPVVLSADVLEEALGLAKWELEDIREEVDRRVGGLLKQARALRWLWSHFGLPESTPEQLFRVLFPAAPGRIGPMGMVRRCGQLYTVVTQDHAPPLESMFLPWLPVDDEKTFHPLRTFRGKYVNNNLRRAMARSLGADDDEVVELLDRMVTIVPRAGSAQFMARDGWRTRGLAGITGLPSPYGAATWIARSLEPDDIATASWMRKSDDGQSLLVGDARAVFDILAVPRVDEMLRQVYGEMLSRAGTIEPTDQPGVQGHEGSDLVLFDIQRHLRAVLQPLLDWAASPRTAATLAGPMGLSPDTVAEALADVARTWNDQFEAAWVGTPSDGLGRSAQTLLTAHLLVTQDALISVLRRKPDPRAPHRDIAMLFAGHYFAHAPLERLWAEISENSTWPGGHVQAIDVVGQWFWGSWLRVLDAIDDEPTSP